MDIVLIDSSVFQLDLHLKGILSLIPPSSLFQYDNLLPILVVAIISSIAFYLISYIRKYKTSRKQKRELPIKDAQLTMQEDYRLEAIRGEERRRNEGEGFKSS